MHSEGHAVTTDMTLIMGLAFKVISKHIILINHQITFIAITRCNDIKEESLYYFQNCPKI